MARLGFYIKRFFARLRRPDGLTEWYYPNGQLEHKGSYRDGKETGYWEYFREDGTMEFRGTFRNGLRDGKWELFHPNGKIMVSGNSKAGRPEGVFERYAETGHLTERATYKNGEMDGPCERFHPNGQVSEKGKYENGKQDGYWEYYYPGGQLMKRGRFINRGRFGLWDFFDENGLLLESRNFTEKKTLTARTPGLTRVLLLQQFELVHHPVPFLGIRRWTLAGLDLRPDLRQLGIELDERPLRPGYSPLLHDRAHRTGRHAIDAVDAGLRVDHQEVGTFVKAIRRTDRRTARVLAVDAVFGNNKRHVHISL
jgi:antitoxin component YwqK of YwqJK toxin-antitoxin module